MTNPQNTLSICPCMVSGSGYVYRVHTPECPNRNPQDAQEVRLPELDEECKQISAYALTLESGAQYTIVSYKAERDCRERQLLSALRQLAAVTEERDRLREELANGK